MHRFIAVALASATFGGVIGALATAAVQSQASPAAIAAAVQKVQDTAADRSLAAEKTTLKSIETDFSILNTDLYRPQPGSSLQQELQYLYAICLNTYQANPASSCSAPVSQPARRP